MEKIRREVKKILLRNEKKHRFYEFSPYDGLDPEIFDGIDSNIWPRPRTFVIGAKFNF